MTDLKEKTNEELARTALDCLTELVQRENKSLEEAATSVSYFLSDILILREMAEALEEVLELEIDNFSNKEKEILEKLENLRAACEGLRMKCPNCGSTSIARDPATLLNVCRGCGQQFTGYVGTINRSVKL